MAWKILDLIIIAEIFLFLEILGFPTVHLRTQTFFLAFPFPSLFLYPFPFFSFFFSFSDSSDFFFFSFFSFF